MICTLIHLLKEVPVNFSPILRLLIEQRLNLIDFLKGPPYIFSLAVFVFMLFRLRDVYCNYFSIVNFSSEDEHDSLP